MATKQSERINFGKIKEVIAPPNLIEIQLDSYREFLQSNLSASKRRNLGLQAVFTEVFPSKAMTARPSWISIPTTSRSRRSTGSNAFARA